MRVRRCDARALEIALGRAHREPLHAANHEPALVGKRRVVVHQPQIGEPAGERRQRGLQFEPRERSAETKVNAEAERHVRIRIAREIEHGGRGELPLVAIRAGIEQPDLRADRNRHAADLAFFEHPALEERQRRIESQQFLNGRLHERGIARVRAAATNVSQCARRRMNVMTALLVPFTVAS